MKEYIATGKKQNVLRKGNQAVAKLHVNDRFHLSEGNQINALEYVNGINDKPEDVIDPYGTTSVDDQFTGGD